VIDVEPHVDGCLVHVRAQAGARQSAVRATQDGRLKVSVTQAPERGKANKAIVAVLSKQLQLRKSQIQIVSGTTSSQKKVLFNGVTPEDLRTRLETLFAEDER
jgi:uncharacterized protein (TIGR00251 family)